ncbi:solute carrier family 52, riboflavin transporter, member 3-like [Saccoglossus kowalevskii]
METEDSKYRLYFVQVCVCLFGMASWLDINGVWVQLPLMVNVLPEGWALASYLVLVIQIANIGPLTFSIVNKFTKKRIEIPTNYLIISIGMVACFLLAPLWDETTYVNGEEHSMALLTLCGFLALVDCTSSVSFLAFMTVFSPMFMTSYFVGEGMSAFVPSILGLLQGSSGNPECVNITYYNETTNTTYYEQDYYYSEPRYSVEVYFLLLAGLLLTSLVSFALLAHLPLIRQFYIDHEDVQLVEYRKSSEAAFDNLSITLDKTPLGTDSVIIQKPITSYGSTDDLSRKGSEEQLSVIENSKTLKRELRRFDWWYLLIIQGYCCSLTNGIMPSIQSYSTLPYGNLAYHLAITLGLMMIPTASLCVHWLPAKSNISIGILTVIGTAVACYITACAAMSPYPPLCGSPWGGVVSVVVWLLFYFIFTYIKVSIGGILRHEGRNALILYGGVTQIGSLCGAILIFPLINTLHLFEPNDPCVFTCY